jgi:hypothetical protein
MTRSLALPLALAALVAAVVAAVVLVGGGEPRTPAGAAAAKATGERAGRWQAPDRSFTVAVPRGWRVTHGPAATVIQRENRGGALVVRRTAKLPGSAADLAKGLDRSLRRSLGEVRTVRSRELTVRGRKGLLYTFVRPADGTVQSVAVVPTADASYTLGAVVKAGDEGAARQLGAMVRSFTPAA